MSNTVKAKQKKTIIISVILSVLLLAGSVFVVVDSLIHMNDPYKNFGDADFAAAFAAAIGKESVRDITQEDIDKVESLVYYYSVGNDSSNSYQTYAYPVVILGYKGMTDNIINKSEEEPEEGSYVIVNYALSEVEDITAFNNLRVLSTFDIAEVSVMQESCYYTQLYAAYGMGTAVSFDTVVENAALKKLKSLEQLSSLEKLEQLSLEYTGITNLNGIENFENLTKLDIGNTEVTDLKQLSAMTSLKDLTLVAMGEKVELDSDAEHTHYGLTDISALSSLVNLESLNIASNAVSDLSPIKDLTKLETLSVNSNCVENLNDIAKLTALTSVAAANNHITDISGVSGLANLETFVAYENEITSLEALEGCTKLTAITAYDNEIETIGDLSALTELASIDVYGNKITKLDGLANCTKLTSINAYKNEIETIGDLSKLDALTTISVYDNNIKDLNGLNGCEKLETISAYNNTLSGTLDLSGCTALKTLDIYVEPEEEEEESKDDSKEETSEETSEESTDETTNESEDVAGPLPSTGENEGGLSVLVINGLESLTSVDAHGNAIIAVPDITGCYALKTLNLSDNKISDLSALANILDKAGEDTEEEETDEETTDESSDTSDATTSDDASEAAEAAEETEKDGEDKEETKKTYVLATLNLADNEIVDISGLAGLSTVKSLDLSNNKITDITAIGTLKQLETLKLSGNADLVSLAPISDNFETTTKLELEIIGTKAAEDNEALKALQSKFATMVITYTEKEDK